DLGARYKGYMSDTARATVVGGEPTPEQRRFLDTQVEIVHETVAMIRPGVAIGELAARAQQLASESEFADFFYFRGHGIGATTHIPPSFVPGSKTILEAGM